MVARKIVLIVSEIRIFPEIRILNFAFVFVKYHC